jgi:hypothetical protein
MLIIDSIFEKSVNSIETINGASADVHAARFQWHIGKSPYTFCRKKATDSNRRNSLLSGHHACVVGASQSPL